MFNAPVLYLYSATTKCFLVIFSLNFDSLIPNTPLCWGILGWVPDMLIREWLIGNERLLDRGTGERAGFCEWVNRKQTVKHFLEWKRHCKAASIICTSTDIASIKSWAFEKKKMSRWSPVCQKRKKKVEEGHWSVSELYHSEAQSFSLSFFSFRVMHETTPKFLLKLNWIQVYTKLFYTVQFVSLCFAWTPRSYSSGETVPAAAAGEGGRGGWEALLQDLGLGPSAAVHRLLQRATRRQHCSHHLHCIPQVQRMCRTSFNFTHKQTRQRKSFYTDRERIHVPSAAYQSVQPQLWRLCGT